jgi:hypothetical protein
MLFIFGGVGLGVSYLIEEKKIKEEKDAEGSKRNNAAMALL